MTSGHRHHDHSNDYNAQGKALFLASIIFITAILVYQDGWPPVTPGSVADAASKNYVPGNSGVTCEVLGNTQFWCLFKVENKFVNLVCSGEGLCWSVKLLPAELAPVTTFPSAKIPVE